MRKNSFTFTQCEFYMIFKAIKNHCYRKKWSNLDENCNKKYTTNYGNGNIKNNQRSDLDAGKTKGVSCRWLCKVKVQLF